MERSEWAKPTERATTMWVTQHADGFNPPFRSEKNVSISIAIAFEMDKIRKKLSRILSG